MALASEARNRVPALLAQQVGISRAAIRDLIDGLERQKFVHQIARPIDRHSLTIKVTYECYKVLNRPSTFYDSKLQ